MTKCYNMIEIEYEQQKKERVEQRRRDLEAKRKKAREEQKRKEQIQKQKFLEAEQRKEAMKAAATHLFRYTTRGR